MAGIRELTDDVVEWCGANL